MRTNVIAPWPKKFGKSVAMYPLVAGNQEITEEQPSLLTFPGNEELLTAARNGKTTEGPDFKWRRSLIVAHNSTHQQNKFRRKVLPGSNRSKVTPDLVALCRIEISHNYREV